MKVLHILLDSYHPNNGGTCPKLVDESLLQSKFDKSELILTEDPTSKKLISPLMWARTSIGHQPPKDIPRYSPNMRDDKAVEVHGYTSISVDDWIWNKLAKVGVKSFNFPYYLIKQLPLSSITDSDYPTIYLRDYTESNVRVIDEGSDMHLDSDIVYSSLGKRFDYGFTPDDKRRFYDLWNNNEYKTIIDEAKVVIPRLYEDLDTNMVVWNDIITRLGCKVESLSPDEDFYSFIGVVEPDCINHFTHPYTEFNKYFRESYMNKIIELLIECMDPDVLIMHGDHNMVPTYRSRVKYKFEYNGYSAVRAGYSPVPFYTDHGNQVGGYIMYNDKVSNRVQSLLDDSEGLLMDRVYKWATSELGGDTHGNI